MGMGNVHPHFNLYSEWLVLWNFGALQHFWQLPFLISPRHSDLSCYPTSAAQLNIYQHNH